MKDRVLAALKSFGQWLVLLLLGAVWLYGTIAELFPTMIPDWLYKYLFPVNIGIIIAVVLLLGRYWLKQRKK